MHYYSTECIQDVSPLTSSLLFDVTRSMCCGSSVSVKDTTEFLSFPSSRTCLQSVITNKQASMTTKAGQQQEI